MKWFLLSVLFVSMTVFAPLAVADSAAEKTRRSAVSDTGPVAAGGLLYVFGRQLSLTPGTAKLIATTSLCSGAKAGTSCGSQSGDCATPCLVLQFRHQHIATFAAGTLMSANGERIEGISRSNRLRPPI